MKFELLPLISFAILCLPTAWELWNDRKGDPNKEWDTIIRVFLMILTGCIVMQFAHKDVFASINLSVAIFFLTFDYLISYILIRNGTIESPAGLPYRWWTYKAKVGLVDNIAFWRNMNPWVKLAIRVVYFAISLYLFLTLQL